jgi:hypothetical protein
MAKSGLFNPWALALQSTMLAIEANQVIALRMAKLAMGGDRKGKESRLMVTEKIQAMGEAGRVATRAALGGKSDLGARKIVRLYRGKVRANRRRLS